MSGFFLRPAEIVVEQSWVASSTHTGTTAETTLRTVSIPAALTGINGAALLEAWWTFGGANGTRTPRIRYGGQQAYSLVAASNQLNGLTSRLVGNRGLANSQLTTALGAVTPYGTVAGEALRTFAVDSAAAVDVTFTIALASALDTAVLEGYRVIVYPKA